MGVDSNVEKIEKMYDRLLSKEAVAEMIKGLTEYVADGYRTAILRENLVATGELVHSVGSITYSAEGYIYGAQYGIYQDYGTKPHLVPLPILEEWALNKAMAGGIEDPHALAVAAQKSIAKRGNMPRRLTEKALSGVDKKIDELFEEMIGKKIKG